MIYIFLLKIIHKILTLFKAPLYLIIKFNDYYHNIIFKKLQKYFNLSLNNIKNIPGSKKINSKIIWIFWWQGITNMPLIVKSCIRSIYSHSNHYKIILITKYNIKHYACLPKYIYNKVKSKKISLTHLSDILRFNLLDQYGGLWVDSTVFCASDINTQDFTHIYTSGGYIDTNKYHQFVTSKWTGFLIGGNSHSDLFQFMNSLFNIYWQNNNHLIDYYLIDYALKYAYIHNISNFKHYVDNYAYLNNPHLYSLVNNLDNIYNSNTYNSMIKDTQFFKLTYKNQFNNNKDTFFNRLVHNKLE